jgi:hypothetical protein
MDTPVRILGVALVVAAIVALCLMSMTGAMVIGGVTMVAVGLDGLRMRGTRTTPMDQRLLSVDLSRRY